MHKLRLALPILAAVSLLAACGSSGGGGAKLQADDVAVVGDHHITNADFNAAMSQLKLNYKAQGQPFPKQGTTEYQSAKSSAVLYLVQQAETQSAADSMGVTVTDAQVESKLKQVKESCCKGNEKKYEAELKQAHLTDAQLRKDVRRQLRDQQLEAQVTKNVTVSDAAAHTYYNQHLSTYTKPASRQVQYLLIKSKSLAQSLYQQLKSGNAQTWCRLAKKYSGDPTSKNTCGKPSVPFTKGQTVKAFDTVLFSQPTGVVHPPVYDSQQYKAWSIIRPLSAVTPKSVTPYSAVSASIKQQLLQQQQQAAVRSWATNLQKSFCKGSKIKYQAGYQPSPDPCASTTNLTTT